MTLLTSVFSDDTIAQQFSDEQFVAYMLDFEIALAKVQGRLGIIPQDAAVQITSAVEGFQYQREALYDSMEKSSVPTIALIQQLRDVVDEEYGSFVHWGATSQDVMDTALVLQLKACITQMQAQMQTVMAQLAHMADAHRHTVMAGRTHSQQALPITFGFKVANWLAPLLRHVQRLEELKPRLLVLQFGGAVGTLASLDDKGLAVARALADELNLGLSSITWHTQRDNIAEFASWLSLVTGSLGKMAQDVILMAQSEIAELLESDDTSRGGSSTMPQKHNPIISEIILTCAQHNANLLASMHQAMIQEHERATGNWQLEWLALPQILHLTMTALRKAVFLSENLVVNVARMQANVRASNGLMLAEAIELALATHIGRSDAKRIIKVGVQVVLSENRHLVDVMREQVEVNLDWSSLREEANYLGQTDAFINHVIKEVDTL